MKRLVTAFLAAGITVSSMTAVLQNLPIKRRVQARRPTGN